MLIAREVPKKYWGFLSGIFLSQFVNSALHLIQPMLIADLTGSLGYAAFFSSFDTAVHMAGTFFGGWPIDRFGSKRVLMLATLLRGFSLALIPLLMILGKLTVVLAMIWYTVDAFVRGFVDASEYSLPLELCNHDRAQLDQLNSQFEFIFDLGGFLGPLLLGAVMLSLKGVAAHLIIPAGFILSAFAFLFIPKTNFVKNEYSNKLLKVGTLAGFKIIFSDKKLLWTCIGLVSFNIYPLRKLLSAFFAKSILHLPASVGVIGSAFGIGGMFGAFIYAKFQNRKSISFWIVLGSMGLVSLAIGWIPENLIFMSLCVFIFAVTNTSARLSLTGLRQERTPLNIGGGVTAASRFAANIVSVALKALIGVLFSLGRTPVESFTAVSICLILIAVFQFFQSRKLVHD